VNPSSRCRRREVRYSGHVQGVGFRFTTQQIARHFAVDGYVRNLSDGRVQLVTEGESEELDRFLQAVHERMGDHIDDVSADTQAPSGEFKGFSIRY
jgi:acylphosphatase